MVLVGLAAKNAILIVEFARQTEDEGAIPEEAAVTAARTRLRPILMTSFAFILGVAPLVVATGAGSEMRQSLGTTVFAGMLGVTAFGLLLDRPTSAAVARPSTSPSPFRFSADRGRRIQSTGTCVVPCHQEATLGSRTPRNGGKLVVWPVP